MKKMTGLMNWGLLVLGGSLVVGGAASYFSPSQGDAVASVAEAGLFPAPDPSLPTVKVWKSPLCGCCGGWVDHLRMAGFEVEVVDMDDLTPIKNEHGIGPQLASCHTAWVDGYALEGHIPAEDILRLLAQRPDVRGLAVPGMPIGSPGMEAGNQRERYNVLTFGHDGKTAIWATHN